jgi:hypothetical protein
LNPGFVPKAPRALRLLASVFGYMRAEQCAVHYRHAKRLLRGSVDPACASPEPGSNA